MMEWFGKHHAEWFDTLTEGSQAKLREPSITYTSINPDKFLDHLFFPSDKPKAFVTLDDRALTFNGYFPQVSDLLEFTPWNRRSERAMLGVLKYKGIEQAEGDSQGEKSPPRYRMVNLPDEREDSYAVVERNGPTLFRGTYQGCREYLVELNKVQDVSVP